MKLLQNSRRICALVFSLLIVSNTFSQTLDLPPRATNALSGSNFVAQITSLSLTNRENAIYTQIAQGNVPIFLRQLIPITATWTTNATTYSAIYYVTPEYLAIGSDEDYFLEPMTPILAQRIAALLHCSLPTRKMVNQIWTNAAVKLDPSPIAPSPQMTTVPVFAQHNATVRGQRNQQLAAHPFGALVGGHKKDVIISNRIYTNFANANITKPVVIYGWHYTTGSPIQPLYNGHEDSYADYSHGIRLAQTDLTVNGVSKTIPQVLKDPILVGLLSDEGIISVPNYPIVPVTNSSLLFKSMTVSNQQFRSNLSGLSDEQFLLEASTNLVAWKPVLVQSNSNITDLEATNYRQRFYRAHTVSTQTIADFELFTAAAEVLFRSPNYSGSTSNFLDLTVANFTRVTNTFPPGHASSNVLQATWSFKSGTSNPWLRLTTFNAANLPNPVVGFSQVLQFDIYSDKNLYLTIGLRETNTFNPIGTDGGTTGSIEWVGGITQNITPPKGHFIPAGQWINAQFFIPNEPVRGFTGNGILQSTTGKGVFEHLCIVPADIAGVYNIYLDNFQVVDFLP